MKTTKTRGIVVTLTPAEKLSNQLEMSLWHAQYQRNDALKQAAEIAADLRRAADDLDRDVLNALAWEGRHDVSSSSSDLTKHLHWAFNAVAQRAGHVSTAAVDGVARAFEAKEAEAAFRRLCAQVAAGEVQ